MVSSDLYSLRYSPSMGYPLAQCGRWRTAWWLSQGSLVETPWNRGDAWRYVYAILWHLRPSCKLLLPCGCWHSRVGSVRVEFWCQEIVRSVGIEAASVGFHWQVRAKVIYLQGQYSFPFGAGAGSAWWVELLQLAPRNRKFTLSTKRHSPEGKSALLQLPFFGVVLLDLSYGLFSFEITRWFKDTGWRKGNHLCCMPTRNESSKSERNCICSFLSISSFCEALQSEYKRNIFPRGKPWYVQTTNRMLWHE
jgi:hypothetical protein